MVHGMGRGQQGFTTGQQHASWCASVVHRGERWCWSTCPAAAWLTAEWQEKMAKIEECLHCGQCSGKCPYGLDTPKLLEENLKDFREVLSQQG